MTQIEDGLILKVASATSGQTQRVVLAKNPVFKDEEEKKGDEMEVVEAPKIVQPDEIQLYDFTNKVNLKEQSISDLKAVLVLPSGE